MQRWADRLREVLRQKADAFFSLEGAVLAGDDPEAIHDMRVASRRLQEVLRLVFAGDPRLAGLVRGIRGIRRVQSRVRDLDVMAGRLRRMEKGAGADAQEALRFAREEIAARRRRRHRKMAGGFKGLDLGGLRSDLDGLTARPEGGPDPPGAPALAEVARRGQAQIAGRAAAFRGAVSTARISLRPEDLHNARIAGKRLRYILEVCDELRVGGFKKRIGQMRDIQQALGHWHDLEVLEETFIGMLADPEAFRRRLPLVRAGCGLIAGWRAEKEAHIREFLKLIESCPLSTDRSAGARP